MENVNPGTEQYIRDLLISELEAGKNSFDIMPFHIVRNWLINKGYIYLDEEFDTNGWQVDFWAYFAKPEDYLTDKVIYKEKEYDRGRNLKSSYSKIIMVSGSMYYGGLKIDYGK